MTRFWLETITATITGFLFALTLFTRSWIEAVFRVDPDQHSGALEWYIVVTLAVATLVLATAARAEWRRVRLAGI